MKHSPLLIFGATAAEAERTPRYLNHEVESVKERYCARSSVTWAPQRVHSTKMGGAASIRSRPRRPMTPISGTLSGFRLVFFRG